MEAQIKQQQEMNATDKESTYQLKSRGYTGSEPQPNVKARRRDSAQGGSIRKLAPATVAVPIVVKEGAEIPSGAVAVPPGYESPEALAEQCSRVARSESSTKNDVCVGKPTAKLSSCGRL